MKYPILITRGIVVLPSNNAILEVGRDTSIKAIEKAQERVMILLSQKNPSIDEPQKDDLFNVGTLVKFSIDKHWEDGSYKIIVKGLERVKILNPEFHEDHWTSEVETMEDKTVDMKKMVPLFSRVVTEYDEVLSKIGISPANFEAINSGNEPGKLVDIVSSYIPMTLVKKQSLLEERDPIIRLGIILSEVESAAAPKPAINQQQVDNDITQKVNDRLTKQQREFFLRERLKAIKEELGDITSKDNDVETIRNALEENPYPDHIKEKILAELTRYENTPPASSESNVIKNYVDWVMKLPWWQETKDNNSIKNAKITLDEHHYGLEKVKERIVEFLAVKSKSGGLKGPIICLAGPPGVGKTSLAKSIAEALGKKLVKVSLGGVKDESELRGHRRTYLGSQPGRIIQGMKKSKVINPLILLDEIDKMASDQRGDPSAAMLEILDPAQNKHFSDNFIEEEYDLSKVMFVATANFLQNIPSPLMDRMEIIQLSSYTELEKLKIAQMHLVPKVLKDIGLKKTELKFTRTALEHVIKRYTQEAGVRTLERLIHKMSRKFIVKQLQGELKTQTITVPLVRKYLGQEIYDYNIRDKRTLPGTVTGLAWTAFGGDTLPIEVSYYDGKGGLTLTGQQKDVMKESATIALSFVKANATRFGISPKFFEKHNIHIHVPDGSTPKDGPSAGVTFTTAIISSLTKTSVPANIGMTGEISLVGKVMRIGGLKEKAISSVRSGLDTIFIPKENMRDIEDIPEETRKVLKVIPVSKYQEIYKHIFKKPH